MQKEHRMLNAKQLRTQGFKQFQIAEIMGVTERTVRNYLKNPAEFRKRPIRQHKLDALKQFIDNIIESNPYYNCILLHDRLLRQGYTGKISILRDYVADVRKKEITEAVIRFETEPGRQAQVDWKEYRRTLPNGRKEKVYAFNMVMGYSRKPFVKFTKSMEQSVLLACHIEAFEHLGGVPQEILYDNMKTAFVCDSEAIWRPNKHLLAFANHYGFIPKRCQVRRPQTKGKVERAIGYLNTNFWPQVENGILDPTVLNEAVKKWMAQTCEKELRDFKQTRAQRFEHEKKYLNPLPEKRYDYRDTCQAIVSRESLITFETNRYSVPPEYIGQRLELKIDPINGAAEVFSGSKSIRLFELKEPGGRKTSMTPEDREAIRKVWLKQQENRLKRQKHTKPIEQPPVLVRSPASYEKLICDEEMA